MEPWEDVSFSVEDDFVKWEKVFGGEEEIEIFQSLGLSRKVVSSHS